MLCHCSNGRYDKKSPPYEETAITAASSFEGITLESMIEDYQRRVSQTENSADDASEMTD